MKRDNILITGYEGVWYVIDETIKDGESFFLLEHEEYGDEVGCLIVNEDYVVIVDEVWNGLEELDY